MILPILDIMKKLFNKYEQVNTYFWTISKFNSNVNDNAIS